MSGGGHAESSDRIRDYRAELLLLDDDRKAEVLNFILSLTAKSKVEASPAKTANEIDPMRYSGTVSWPVDGLTYQEKLRGEWE
jgi:hypothetical protein